jgi:hypothetical protein
MREGHVTSSVRYGKCTLLEVEYAFVFDTGIQGCFVHPCIPPRRKPEAPVSRSFQGASIIIPNLELVLKEPYIDTCLTHKYIVSCRVVRVTKITGSGSDDWNYWHFGYTLCLLIRINTALSLIYIIYSSPLHTH